MPSSCTLGGQLSIDRSSSSISIIRNSICLRRKSSLEQFLFHRLADADVVRVRRARGAPFASRSRCVPSRSLMLAVFHFLRAPRRSIRFPLMRCSRSSISRSRHRTCSVFTFAPLHQFTFSHFTLTLGELRRANGGRPLPLSSDPFGGRPRTVTHRHLALGPPRRHQFPRRPLRSPLARTTPGDLVLLPKPKF